MYLPGMLPDWELTYVRCARHRRAVPIHIHPELYWKILVLEFPSRVRHPSEIRRSGLQEGFRYQLAQSVLSVASVAVAYEAAARICDVLYSRVREDLALVP